MYVLAINHQVSDYDEWKSAYDTMPPTARGAAFSRVNRGVDEPNLVTVVAGFESLATLNGFISDPELKAKMQDGGVKGEPRIEIYEEVEVI